MKEIQQDLVKWKPSGQKEESKEVQEQVILLREKKDSSAPFTGLLLTEKKDLSLLAGKAFLWSRLVEQEEWMESP